MLFLTGSCVSLLCAGGFGSHIRDPPDGAGQCVDDICRRINGYADDVDFFLSVRETHSPDDVLTVVMEKGVKAPYRKGGYTAEEIEKMGNKARSDWKYYNGNKAYEGYYLAPDGKYYPVDQVKANYYRETGSYNGWDEGMRDYWNTFGTFYGYRPGWRTTGRLGGGGGGGYSSSRSYSYSGGGGSRSGGSGGSSSAANSGYYWNGNTSWSI